MASTEKDDRWAPWWVYVPVILVLNLIKQQFMDGVPVAINLAITVVLIGVAVLVITWAWRAFRPA